MKYCYLNLHPLGKTEPDCVYRAITLATQDDYEIIDEKIVLHIKVIRVR